MKLTLISMLGLALVAAMPLADQKAKQKETFKEAMKARERCGLQPQTLDPELCKIAQRWAEHMAARNCMYHGGGEQIIAHGYKTPKATVNAWMCSSGHRKWILSKCKKVGFGYATSKSGHTYWAGVYRN